MILKYVWDPFVRIFHWSLVGAFAVAFYYHESVWDRLIHVQAGYVAGGLLVARIVWGLMQTGSLVIYAMLAFGLTAVASGWLVFNEGWLWDAPEILKPIHHFSTWGWLALVVIHVSGVIFESLIHKDNLIWAMITGCKRVCKINDRRPNDPNK